MSEQCGDRASCRPACGRGGSPATGASSIRPSRSRVPTSPDDGVLRFTEAAAARAPVGAVPAGRRGGDEHEKNRSRYPHITSAWAARPSHAVRALARPGGWRSSERAVQQSPGAMSRSFSALRARATPRWAGAGRPRAHDAPQSVHEAPGTSKRRAPARSSRTSKRRAAPEMTWVLRCRGGPKIAGDGTAAGTHTSQRVLQVATGPRFGAGAGPRRAFHEGDGWPSARSRGLLGKAF